MSKLPAHRYDEIRDAVADFLEDFGITEYPIDIFGIVLSMGIRLVPFSSLDAETRQLMNETCKYPDAATRRPRQLDVRQVTIFYNDIGFSRERIRFTIAHELGHLYLDTDDEDEADNFARDLLAPPPLVIEYSSEKTRMGLRINEERVVNDFEVSYGCAHVIVDRIINRLYSGRPLLEYESRISHQCHMAGRAKQVMPMRAS